ncbi:MAG: sigma-70 family RNA polymerase sigma factor [Ignavibacteriaceae bacterium]
MKDTNLILQWFNEARLGNKQCFNNLVTYYHASLLSYALKICKYNNIAEDALQEAYINAYIHFNEVEQPEKLLSWLLTIVRRSCWLQMKSSKSFLPLSVKQIDSKIFDAGLERNFEQNNLNEYIHERINHLSDTLKIVVLMRYFTVYNDYESISEILGIPVGTIRSRLNEAKKQLKKVWNYSLSDLPENIQRESSYWNEFYFTTFNNVHIEENSRLKLIEHILPNVKILYTSGKTATGREPIKKELDEDIKFGIRYNTQTVFNLKDIGIIQGENINSAEYPDRCPPTSTFIFKRIKEKAFFMQIHNEARKTAS